MSYLHTFYEVGKALLHGFPVCSRVMEVARCAPTMSAHGRHGTLRTRGYLSPMTLSIMGRMIRWVFRYLFGMGLKEVVLACMLSLIHI